uniref:NADH-ubiquinone oxidoreductase chain 3 n=1 Tax=Scotomedes sp. TaxID=2931908 RepID=A0A8T9W3Y9_9HEMI|nr:NADH dehydrogenase subunit 3 [Scotomedes sp.]
MLKLISMLTMCLMISIILIVLCTMINKKSLMDREKMSPFECGFDPQSSSRMPFSMQFFLVGTLFLIFDIEIMIMLPMIITMKNTPMLTWFFTMTMFLIIIIIGLYHEWKNGILEWTY